jgi:hypothetical protein
MRTYEYAGEPLSEPRSHPWQGSANDSLARYLDFRASPELIRSSLEDFKPFQHYAAIEEFYALLELVNHPRSQLESNDCAFNGPGPNQTLQVPASHECSGRVMLLFRELEQNARKSRMAWLNAALHYQLAKLDPKFVLGMIGTTLVPVRFLALPQEGQRGQQLLVSFWAFGDSDAVAMRNLSRLFKNLSQALRVVSARIASGQ